MKVSFLNQQKQYKVGRDIKDLIKRCCLATLEYMDFRTDVEISVVLTDNEEIRTLNSLHRNIDYAEFNEMGELCLGDIVISMERAHEQAEEYGHSSEREIGFLTVHSMLHLLGYDHMTPEDETEMFGYQREILDKIGLVR